MVFKEKLNRQEIRVLARKYKKAMEKAGYPVTKLILFGSYARGSERDWSDVDFVVISPKYEQKDDFNEAVRANVIAAQVSLAIEAHIATLAEFENCDSPWLAEAKKYGKEII